MTTDQDFERVLDRWFAQRRVEAHGSVIDVVAGRIEHQRQRPAWRVSRRDTPVNGSIKQLAAIAAVIAIAVAGVALAVMPSGPNVGRIASPSLAPTSTPSPAPTVAWDNSPECGVKGCGGPLTAGTYTSTGLQPPVTYTLTTPWVNVSDWPDFFMLYPDTNANRDLAAAGASAGDYAPYILIQPGALRVPSRTACGIPRSKTGLSNVETDVAGFIAGLRAEDGLTVSFNEPPTVSGLNGVSIWVTPEPGWTGCLPGTPFEEHTAKHEGFGYLVFNTPDSTSLLITIWERNAPYQPFLQDAYHIVESFEFDLTH
jgi:hypothetical protein